MLRLAAMPSLPDDPHASYRLLGLVGHYLAACHRHEAPLSDAIGARQAAWSNLDADRRIAGRCAAIGLRAPVALQ